MYVQGVIAALAGRIGQKESDFLLQQPRSNLCPGPVLDPMDFQLLTDDFPAASYPAIPAPLVIDPVAENGPIGMVVSIQCGSRCLERLNQHGHTNHQADPDEPAQQGQRNTPACGQAQPAL